jgi:hypothetical protein
MQGAATAIARLTSVPPVLARKKLRPNQMPDFRWDGAPRRPGSAAPDHGEHAQPAQGSRIAAVTGGVIPGAVNFSVGRVSNPLKMRQKAGP